MLHALSSYSYFGWVLDQLGDDDPEVADNSLSVSAWAILGVSFPTRENVGGQYELLYGTWMTEAFTLLMQGDVEGNDGAVDQDVTVGEPYGNGGGSTVYRLREGIERFLVTDINNAAASAKAQSDIWIMSDWIATIPSAYNHAPGGANVLFREGHVSFSKYPGEPPLNREFAEGVGIVVETFFQ